MGHHLREKTNSENYRGGRFRNLLPTRLMAEGVSFGKVMANFINRPANTRPPAPLPSVRTNLKELRADSPCIIWFGHSSYLISAFGINILVDPVFSGYASPLSSFVRAFPGSDIYGVDDLPELDMVVITHDHYDHLDKKTIEKLKTKTPVFCTALGVGKEILRCGVQDARVVEMDWWETERFEVRAAVADTVTGLQRQVQQTNIPEPGGPPASAPGAIQVTAVPARHFSGRGLKRGNTLWAAFVLDIGKYRFFLGGDSGYGDHFADIGKQYGPFDIALLECGQYDPSWPDIHMMPEQTVQAAVDLGAKLLLPVHWGKFALANHAWNDPVIRSVRHAANLGVSITTPRIGEPVVLGEAYPDTEWWT